MKERFSKLLLSSALAVLLSSSIGGLSAADTDKAVNRDTAPVTRDVNTNRDVRDVNMNRDGRDVNTNRDGRDVNVNVNRDGHNIDHNWNRNSWDQGYAYNGGFNNGYNGCGYNNNNGCYDNNYCCQPACCNNSCLCLAVDFLYWNACQEDVDIAVVDNSTVDLGSAETQFFEFRYKPGFRVALSYALPCDCLSLDLIYTYWHPRLHKRFTAPAGGSLYGTTLPAALSDLSAEASTDLKQKYDLFDVLLSKTMRCGDCSKMRPYAGVRVLWFRQRWDTTYTATTAPNTFGGETLYRVDAPAAGFTVGAEGKYHVCDGISLIGHLGTSILGGRFKHHQDFVQTSATATWRSEHRHHCQVIGGWDGSLGLAYDFCCCNWPVELAVGYEIQDWWNMPQRARFVDESPSSQVTSDSGSRFTLHGAFARLGLCF